MNPVPKLTMDIKRVSAMEHTRDFNKKLNDFIYIRHELMIKANRDMTKFVVKTGFFMLFFREITKIKTIVAFFMASF
jgi:hypothetical protein